MLFALLLWLLLLLLLWLLYVHMYDIIQAQLSLRL